MRKPSRASIHAAANAPTGADSPKQILRFDATLIGLLKQAALDSGVSIQRWVIEAVRERLVAQYHTPTE